MTTKRLLSTLSLSLGITAVLFLLGLLAGPGSTSHAARAQSQPSSTEFVGGVLTVCPDGPPHCDYSIIQDAVDAARDGDVVKIAQGVYTDVNTHANLAQVVYLNKSIVIRGGYSADLNDPPHPDVNPTTLDAQGQGRVLYIAQNITPTIEGLHITGGDAAGLGGGLSNKDAGGGVYVINARAIISQNWVFSNSAQSGGGLFLWHSDATLNGNTVLSNSAQYYGGGLALRNSDATLNRNTVAANTTESGGGLFLYTSDATLDENTIAANTASSYGGGLYLASSDAVFGENVISGNTADYSGGLYLYTSDATLNKNTITANSAQYHGGGLYLYTSDAKLNGNTIVANVAGSYGGGLYLYNRSDATFVNDVVADNEAAALGSGLYVQGSSPRLLHTTIARNGSTGLPPGSGADGRGLYVANLGAQDSTVVMTNTILVSHSIGIEVIEGNEARLKATLWANDADWVGAGEIMTGTANWWGDPAFAEPDAGDYHITHDSTARDRGVNTGVTTDMDGQSRPQGSGYDIGADELVFNPALMIAQQAAPNPVQAGSQLTYTLRVTNSGNVDLHATVANTLPMHVAPSGMLVWTPDAIAPGGVWVRQVVVTVTPDYVGPLVNVIQVATEEGATGASTSVVTAVEKLITVGPLQGDTLAAACAGDTAIVVQVPEGAVQESTQLGYSSVLAVAGPPPDLGFAGCAFRLKAYRRGVLLPNFFFEKPIVVTLYYSEASVAGLDPGTLELRYWDGLAWSAHGITVIERDTPSKRLTASVAHLSEFATFAQQGRTLYLPLVARESW